MSLRLQSAIDNVRIPEEVVKQLLDQIRAGEDKRKASIEKRLANLKGELAYLAKLRDQAYVDKLNQLISVERWKEMDEAWGNEAEKIEKTISELEGVLRSSGADDARAAFELLEQSSELYSRQPFEEQARGLKILVLNCRLTDEKVESIYRKPFDLVAEGLRSGSWYPGQES